MKDTILFFTYIILCFFSFKLAFTSILSWYDLTFKPTKIAQLETSYRIGILIITLVTLTIFSTLGIYCGAQANNHWNLIP